MSRSPLRSPWAILPVAAAAVGSPLLYVLTEEDAGANRGPEAMLGGWIVLAIVFGLAALIARASWRRSALYGRPLGLAIAFAVASVVVWPVTLIYWTLGPRPIEHR